MVAPRRQLCGCFLFLLMFAMAPRTVNSKLVTSLPGFHGRLPFNLHTGYVEVDEGTELFYYFVQSEARAQEEAPFLLWLTGGDHCSVFSGLANEIGPIRFVVEPYNGSIPRLQINPNSWTKVAHILFVDSPVGAGFSYSRRPRGYEVGDVSSSVQIHDFLIKWFSDHPKYLQNPFYIGGDSYAGKLVPFIVHIISQGIEAGNTPVLNLKGYLVGNPSTGEIIDISSKVPYAHGVGIISDQLYETILGHCQGLDYLLPSNAPCAKALDTFNHLMSQVQQSQILLDNCVYASSAPTRPAADDTKAEYSGDAGRRILVGNPPARPPFGCVDHASRLPIPQSLHQLVGCTQHHSRQQHQQAKKRALLTNWIFGQQQCKVCCCKSSLAPQIYLQKELLAQHKSLVRQTALDEGCRRYIARILAEGKMHDV
uniref:Uncharacterized protein n=1 Tax=Avena sativa TaxID=4498 RepID=A0ACD5XGR6_AVESA